jgi:Na+/proline symporter
MIAIFYASNKFLAVGVRLFSGSILVSTFFDLSIYLAITIIAGITFFYTLIGGLKAVVRTDIIQMFIFTLGGLLAHYLIPLKAESSWLDLMSLAYDAGKLNLYGENEFYAMIIGLIGGVVFDMSTHGVDQDFMQRLTANKSLKSAQKAIIFSSSISIIIACIFLGIGSLLWAYSQQFPMGDIKPDQIFAFFITEHFPPGIKGIMVAGVLAATMSTLDSTINALSACFYNDIFKHNFTDSKSIKRWFMRDTLIITIILLIIAFIASHSDGMLELGLKITSWTTGSLLAVFFNTLFFKNSKLTVLNVVITYALGISVVFLNSFFFELHWSLNSCFSFAIGVLFGFIVKSRSSSGIFSK